MQVTLFKNSSTFHGEDEETLTLRTKLAEGSPNQDQVEIILEDDGHVFCASLNDMEVKKLAEFLERGYDSASSGLLVLGDKNEISLVFRHDNMGEPYREGVRVRVSGSDHFPDHLGPFIEKRQANEMRRFLVDKA